MDYKTLKKLSPETARQAVLQYLSSNKGNISDCAKFFRVQRLTVYDILKKAQQSDLTNRSKAPKTVRNKTPLAIERIILQTKLSTGYGAKKLSKYLALNFNLQLPVSTIKGVIKRNIKTSSRV